MKVIAGKMKQKDYRGISLADTVGKTVEAVSEADYADAPLMLVTLHFTDGTEHSFVLPQEEE